MKAPLEQPVEEGAQARPAVWVLLVGVLWIVAMTYVAPPLGIELSASFQKALLSIEPRHAARNSSTVPRCLKEVL